LRSSAFAVIGEISFLAKLRSSQNSFAPFPLASIFPASLIRDAHLGRIHPAKSFLTQEVVAKTVLDISLDEQPRWG
jgi:hypothetical protein